MTYPTYNDLMLAAYSGADLSSYGLLNTAQSLGAEYNPLTGLYEFPNNNPPLIGSDWKPVNIADTEGNIVNPVTKEIVIPVQPDKNIYPTTVFPNTPFEGQINPQEIPNSIITQDNNFQSMLYLLLFMELIK